MEKELREPLADDKLPNEKLPEDTCVVLQADLVHMIFHSHINRLSH